MYKRFVEIGRVALINEGPDQGKLCVIIDVIDQRRVRCWCEGSHHFSSLIARPLWTVPAVGCGDRL